MSRRPTQKKYLDSRFPLFEELFPYAQCLIYPSRDICSIYPHCTLLWSFICGKRAWYDVDIVR